MRVGALRQASLLRRLHLRFFGRLDGHGVVGSLVRCRQTGQAFLAPAGARVTFLLAQKSNQKMRPDDLSPAR